MIKTEKLKIVVFSGGTGAASLLAGLKHFDKTGKAMEVTSIVNAYDDGKFTGEVRKVCDVLGPSDIRKNQWHQYKNKYNKKINAAFRDFFNKRYNFKSYYDFKEKHSYIIYTLFANKSKVLDDVWFKTFHFSSIFNSTIKDFLQLENAIEIDYSDVNLANIIYAMFFRKFGYERTIQIFKKILDIDDDVVLISTDNLLLRATATSGKIINTESEIVSYNNSSDPITKIHFVPWYYSDNKYRDKYSDLSFYPNIHPTALKKIESADLIIFAPGTQWSSLIPTYATPGFSKIIKDSKAEKILLMNNREDGDCIGISAGEILNNIDNYLDLLNGNIKIFINKDADPLLKNIDKCVNVDFLNQNDLIFEYHMGNINGTHDLVKTANCIFERYYRIDRGIDHNTTIFFDFDDTIFSRDPNHLDISQDNLDLLHNLSYMKKCIIATGNGYDTIHEKIADYIDDNYNLYKIDFDIWADGAAVKYENGLPVYRINQSIIEHATDIIYYMKNILKIPEDKIFLRGDWPAQDLNKITCIGIKPLTELEKDLLIEILNFQFNVTNQKTGAKKIGLTGIDIINDFTDKINILDYYKQNYNKFDVNNTFYVGDEIHDGNDLKISNACKFKYSVKSPYDTNILLNVLNHQVKNLYKDETD